MIRLNELVVPYHKDIDVYRCPYVGKFFGIVKGGDALIHVDRMFIEIDDLLLKTIFGELKKGRSYDV